MKFLCPNCHAKYQISEEKVAGRSVKVSCRNCGFVIRVAQPSVTALTSHLASLRPPATGTQSEAQVPARRPPAAATPVDTRPRTQAVSVPKTTAAEPPVRRLLPGAGVQRAPVPRPVRETGPAALVPRPGRSTAVAASNVASAGIGRRGDVIQGGPEQRAHELLRKATALRDPQPEAAPLSSMEDAGALAGAFARAVDRVTAVPAEETTSGDEWWVGIQDVPTGPLKLSDLRIKAAHGAVGPDSLVWREGFADWSPLKRYPELLAVIEEARSRTASSPSLVPLPAPQASSAAQVAISDPFKLKPAEPSPATASSGAVGMDWTADEMAGLTRGPRVPPAAWLAVAAALICGFTGGFVVFSTGSPPTALKGPSAVQGGKAFAAVPAASGAQQATLAKAELGSEEGTPTEGASPMASEAKTARNASGARNTAPSSPTAVSQAQGLSGLRGLSAVRSNGPTGSLDGQSTSSSSSQGLDADTLQKTVSRYKGSVNRSCWQPALDTRDKNAPTTARVSVTVVVSPIGQVQSVSTGGDPVGYRGLARCIESRVRGWQFPASRGSTTVNVPFVFAAQ